MVISPLPSCNKLPAKLTHYLAFQRDHQKPATHGDMESGRYLIGAG